MLPYSKQNMPELNEKRFTISDFGGGLNNVENDSVIADNESDDTKNMRFLSAKLMEKRYGTSLVDNYICGDGVAEAFVAKPIIWVDEYKSNGNTNKFIKCTETAFYVDNVKIIDLLGSKVSGVNYLNKYYFVDGVNVYEFHGDHANIIKSAPESYLTANASATATTINVANVDGRTTVGSTIMIETSGYYEARLVTAVNLTTKVITLDAALRYNHYSGDRVRYYIPNPKVDITGTLKALATAGSTTLSLYDIDYRVQIGWTFITTETGIDSPEPHTISAINRTTGVITFSPALDYSHTKDSTMRYNVPGFTSYYVGQEKHSDTFNYTWYEPCEYELDADFLGDNMIPDNPSLILEHNDRIFLSGNPDSPHEVYMSDISNQMYFPIFTGLQIPPTGDAIQTMIVFDNSLVVSRTGDMYVIRGNNADASASDPFTIDKMDTHIGMIGRQCNAILNNYMFYLGFDKKFYKCNSPTTYVEYLMTSPLTRKIDITLEPLSLTNNDLAITSAVTHNNQYVILIGSKIMLYSYDNQAFTYFVIPGANCLYSDGVDLYIGKTDGTLVLYDKTVYNDVGAAITCKYNSKRYTLNNPMNFKFFKNCMMTTHAWESKLSEITFDFEIDVFNTKVQSNMSLFGVAEWGERFSDKNTYKSKLINLNYKGRDIKIKISNDNLDQPMRMYNINIIYTDRDVR